MYKTNRAIFVFIFLVLLQESLFAAETCEYQSEIQQCIETQTPRAIDDFVCVEWSAETKAFQVILDKRFQEIDEEIEKYIFWLEKAKSKYFWKNKTDHHVDGVLDIHNKFSSHGEYAKLYQSFCGINLVSETATCVWSSIPVVSALDFFQSWTCSRLIETKLGIYEQVAYDILSLNKAQIRSDESKLFVTQERTKYDALIDLFNVNIWYIERILQKWPSKIFNVH